MGERGPAPKRSSQRRRQNKTEPVDQAVSDGTIYGRKLTGKHSAMAKRFWEALRTSGQAQFYEDSDWAVAELIVVAIDAFVAKPSAMMLASLNSAMSSLLLTEGDRRRARLEFERPPADGSEGDDDERDVAYMDDFRRRALGG